MTSGDAVVLAVSTDDAETQCRFAKSLEAPYRMLSDAGAKVTDLYGVRFEMRGMVLSSRALFVVDRDGKLAHVDRSFGVPKALAGTALPAVLAQLVDARLEKLIVELKPSREAVLAGLRVFDRICRNDTTGLTEVPEVLAKLPDPRPSVFDLVVVAKAVAESDKIGQFEVSAPCRLEGIARVAVSVKKQEDGSFRTLAIRVIPE